MHLLHRRAAKFVIANIVQIGRPTAMQESCFTELPFRLISNTPFPDAKNSENCSTEFKHFPRFLVCDIHAEISDVCACDHLETIERSKREIIDDLTMLDDIVC